MNLLLLALTHDPALLDELAEMLEDFKAPAEA